MKESYFLFPESYGLCESLVVSREETVVEGSYQGQGEDETLPFILFYFIYLFIYLYFPVYDFINSTFFFFSFFLL